MLLDPSSRHRLFLPASLILRCCATQSPSPATIRSTTTTHLKAAAAAIRADNSRRSFSGTNSMGSNTSYQAWRVHQGADGSFQGREEALSTNDLLSAAAAASKQQGKGGGDDDELALIRVSHSSLNYKDALSAAGNRGVTRQYPHTPGIDAAGKIAATGEPVLVTGYDLGMNTNGGFGEYICVPKAWVLPLESFPMDPKTAMVYGTAGLTAGLCVQKLLKMGASPTQGKVAVTGATGAVGSVAVEILSRLGFTVVAISGKTDPQHTNLLKELGAKEIMGRDVLELTKKPMVKPIFANAIDTVGGPPLVELLKQIQNGGSVSCCGLVAGVQLETMTVLPFILRGVNLLGVDSVEIPLQEKQAVWKNLAGPWACPKTESMARSIGRHELDACLEAFLKGQSSGKIVLDHSLTVASSSSL